jgi:SMODS and SLOG-associating 2TM effector domain 1/Protein of unknown function (DUF4231)
MPPSSHPDAVRSAWAQQRIWSLTANRFRARIDRARNLALGLGIAGAILSAVALQLGSATPAASRALAVCGGILVGVVPLARRGTSTELISAWTRARAASEGLKTEVYGYLAGGSHYLGDDRQQTLSRRSRRIVSDASDLLEHAAGVQPDSKPIPQVSDVDSYLQERVADQIDHYYRPNAAIYKQRLSTLRSAEWVLGLAAVVLGVLAGTGGITAAAVWIPVATTLAGAIAAHAAAARYQDLVVEYLRTADQLDYLRSSWRDEGLAGSQLVDACEDVISVQNQGWMTRWHQGPRQDASPGVAQ